MFHTRFNLGLLRECRKAVVPPANAAAPAFSRRAFLGLSGTGLAAGAARPPQGFAIARNGRILEVLSEGVVRWSIDPANFGSAAEASFRRTANRVDIGLRNAVFPATTLPAGFHCTVSRSGESWAMEMRWDFGLFVRANWMEWLHQREAAVGSWRPAECNPMPGLRLNCRGTAATAFSPDWTLSVHVPAEARVGGITPELEISGWDLAVNHPDRIAGAAEGKSTTFSFARSDGAWPIDLTRDAREGWSLVHDGETDLFDLLRVEAVESASGPVYSGMLSQSHGNAGRLKFFPGGGLFSTSGDSFHLPLEGPRLAFSLTPEGPQSALVADLPAEPVWAHTEALSVAFAASEEAPHFELTDEVTCPATPAVAPAVARVQCPSDHDCTIQLTFDKPRHTPFFWGKVLEPLERFLGYLNVVGWEHALAFDLSCGDVLTVIRPTDMLKLDFQFEGVRLASGISPHIEAAHRGGRAAGTPPQVGEPVTEPVEGEGCYPNGCLPPAIGSTTNCARLQCQTNGTPRVTVTFPPQHINEQAFYHTSGDGQFNVDISHFTLGDQELKDLRRRTGNPNLTQAQATQIIGYAAPAHPAPDGPAQAFMAGESRLVFHLDLQHDGIPFRLPDLLDWSRWTPAVHPVAQSSTKPANDAPALPARLSDLNPYTSIELPYRLFLSPNDHARWAHSTTPVGSRKSKAVELWHTRLAVDGGKTGPDERNQADRTVRAIYSPDLDPSSGTFNGHTTSDPRFSLDAQDRQELVHLTANFRILQPNLYNPAPVQLDHLMLTPLGAYLKGLGRWEPPMLSSTRVLTVEEWKHIATLGRDQYARVVYKGYLAPFAHRASLIKVTERVIARVNGKYYALLHQRMYIVVQTPRRDFPLFGQPNGGRDFPFRRVDAVTVVTPDLDPPSPTQSLFWPKVNGSVFLFRFRFWDMENRVSEASLPVLFGDAQESQTYTPAAPHNRIVDYYNRGQNSGIPDPSCAPFNRQSIAFAPSGKPGDTRYDVDRMCWRINLQDLGPDTAIQVYRQNLPVFYPTMDRAHVTSASIQRITGDPNPVWVKYYSDYVKGGFDPKVNPGEVVLQVDDTTLPALRFGAAGKTDQAGGLSSPDTLVVGFSRKSGPVGGTAPPASGGSSLQTWAKGTFNPAEFFGGFASAKLLGAVKLADIIAPLLGNLDPGLGKFPRMVQQELYDLEGAAKGPEDAAVSAIRLLQSDVAANPLTRQLAPQAQAVYAAQADRDANANSDALTQALTHAVLIRAIVAYGEALDSLLQDPRSLLAESAVTLLQRLIQNSQFTAFLNAAQNQAFAIVNQVQSAVANAVAAVEQKFFTEIERLRKQAVADVLQLKGDFDKEFEKATVALEQLAPQIFALLDLAAVIQDLVANIAGAKDAAGQHNLQGMADRLGLIGNDLLRIQQSLGALGIAVPVPAVVQKAKDIERDLIRAWDTGRTIQRELQGPLSALHNACAILAAHPIPASPGPHDITFAAATQALQNVRQIERSLGLIDAIRQQFPVVSNVANLTEQQAYRWLQRVQQLQKQVVESANALQTVAMDLLQSADPALVEAAANLIVVLVAPAGTPSFIDQATAFLRLAQAADSAAGHPIETLVQPILDLSADLNSSLSVQLAESRAGLAEARQALTAISPTGQADLAALQAAVRAAAASDIDSSVTPAQRQARHAAVIAAGRQLVTHAVVSELVRVAAARLQVWDFATRYQNIVGTVVSWSLYFQNSVQSAAIQAIIDVAAAIQTLQNVVAPALRAVSTAGKSLSDFVDDPANSPLDILLGDTCHPLAHLPSPPNSTPLAELLQDTHVVMAAVKTAVADIQTRGQDIAAEVKSLASVNSLRGLIAKLPIPHKVSFSFDWKPDIKSFPPVFLLDPGAEFVISARFEVDALSPGQPAYDISATLSKFSINLIGSPSFIIITVSSLTFTSKNGNKPDCRLKIDKIGFGSALSFVQKLAALLNPQKGPFVEFAGGGVRAGFRFQVPSVTMGAFNVMQLAVDAAVQLSFNGDPVRCEFGISDQTHPFLLSSGIFGGGGFFQLQLGLDGVKLLQGALEFGIVAAISIGVLNGSGFVVAGIYMSVGGNDSQVTGFVHAHGHMDIFGLVSMDVDVYVAVSYQSGGSVSGTAEFTVSVHILFFSASFSLQASYQFAGSRQDNSAGLLRHGDAFLADARLEEAAPEAFEYDMSQEQWAEYCAAFAA